MKPNNYLAGCILSLLPLTIVAQQTAAPGPLTQRAVAAAAPAAAVVPLIYLSAAQLDERVVQAEAAAKAGTQLPESARATPSWGPFYGHVVYRSAPTELYFANEDFAEYYVILEGEGTMTIGGTLANPKRTGAHLESATAQGGVPYKVNKGAMLLVPPGTPHRVTQVQGKLVYMSMKLLLQPGKGGVQTRP